MSTLKLGIAQLHPAWGNKAATTQIVIDAIAQAARQGIELLAFSETVSERLSLLDLPQRGRRL